jgi:hypothetical protein
VVMFKKMRLFVGWTHKPITSDEKGRGKFI